MVFALIPYSYTHIASFVQPHLTCNALLSLTGSHLKMAFKVTTFLRGTESTRYVCRWKRKTHSPVVGSCIISSLHRFLFLGFG